MTESLTHFARHLFLIGKVYSERNKSRNEVYNYLERMKKSIIRMSLSYTEIETLKKKIEVLANSERKYAKFLRANDNETFELKKQINALEEELSLERQEKQKLINGNEEKIKKLSELLENIKLQMSHLLIERTRRQQRIQALERKIAANVDIHSYYGS